jgi:hypothetical protein
MTKKWKFVKNFNKNLLKWFSRKKKKCYKLLQKCIYSKKSANDFFMKKNYKYAIMFYFLSLSIVSFYVNKNRSLYFSNRAQCWILFQQNISSTIDYSVANKLSVYYQKSWYRRIFVCDKIKDFMGALIGSIKISILAENFFKKIILFKMKFYCIGLLKLEKILMKTRHWRETYQKKKILTFVFFSNLIKLKDLMIFCQCYTMIKMEKILKSIILKISLISVSNFFFLIMVCLITFCFNLIKFLKKNQKNINKSLIILKIFIENKGFSFDEKFSFHTYIEILYQFST